MAAPSSDIGVKVWAEEPGVEVRVTLQAGVVEIVILKDGKALATATISRYRWERIVARL
jgi:hypothetical protein